MEPKNERLFVTVHQEKQSTGGIYLGGNEFDTVKLATIYYLDNTIADLEVGDTVLLSAYTSFDNEYGRMTIVHYNDVLGVLDEEEDNNIGQ